MAEWLGDSAKAEGASRRIKGGGGGGGGGEGGGAHSALRACIAMVFRSRAMPRLHVATMFLRGRRPAA